jgi:histidinol-phosphate aminotransferase
LTGPVNPRIAALSPYRPGKPVEELTRELGVSDVLKLASNENPRGPGAAVLQAIEQASRDLSRYPDGSGHRLKARLAAFHDIDAARITLGNGSNDVLDLAARATVEPGSQVLMMQHGFVVYYLAANACGAELVEVPARAYGTDLDALLAAVTARTRLVFLANPNNPTGTWVNERALTGFLERLPERIWVVLDEAYFEYVEAADYPNGRTLLERHPNLVVTRTFSKIHALAGLRVGYALSSPALADLMNRARQPFNVSTVALAAAVAALDDAAFVQSSREFNARGMREMTDGVLRLNCSYIPSAGNFLCIEVGDDAHAVYEGLLQRGIIVRPIAEYGLPRHLRVTIGLPPENARFLTALAEVLGRG